jgi:hypothetical protein
MTGAVIAGSALGINLATTLPACPRAASAPGISPPTCTSICTWGPRSRGSLHFLVLLI